MLIKVKSYQKKTLQPLSRKHDGILENVETHATQIRGGPLFVKTFWTGGQRDAGS